MPAATIPTSGFPRLLAARFRQPALVVGLAMVALAIAVALFPREASIAVGAVAGWLLWLAGALMLGFSLWAFKSWLQVTGALAALVAVGFGMYLTFNPSIGALAAILLLGAAFVVDGGFQIAAALHLRPLKVWRWMMASALTSLLAGSILAIDRIAPDELLELLMCAAFGSTGLALLALTFSKQSR